jgi:hypothetical protein
MKFPVLAAAALRESVAQSAHLRSRGRPDADAVSPSLGCTPPDSWFWCYCPDLSKYVCCAIDQTCGSSGGQCVCKAF